MSTSGDALASSLIATISERRNLRDDAHRTVIAVAGESGSGKTVTAERIVQGLAAAGIGAAILHQDDYFHRPPATNHAHRAANLASVGPDEVDFTLLAAHVAAFRAGARVSAPSVDYPGNRFVVNDLDFSHATVLVVEGTYVLGYIDSDVRIFLEATSTDTRERRLARARDIEAPFMEEVLAVEHRIIAAQAGMADVRVNRDFAIVHPPA